MQQNEMSQQSNGVLSLNKHAIALGVAIGMFCSVLPIFQTILASLLALVFRANLPIAALLTWINNPLTFLPITYFTYLIGNHFIPAEYNELVIQEFTWKFASFHDAWIQLSQWTMQFGKPYFIGLVILACAMGVVGYCFVMIPWKKIFFSV